MPDFSALPTTFEQLRRAVPAGYSISEPSLTPHPTQTTSPLLAVPGDVAHRPAAGAHHVVGHIGLVLALPRLVVSSATVGAADSPVLSQGTVEESQLSELHLAELVAALWDLHALLDDLLDLVDRLLDALGVRGRHIRVQWLVFSRQRLAIFPSNFSFFHAAFASDDDFRSSVFLHIFQSISSWSNQKTNKVDIWMVVLGYHHLVTHFYLRSPA